MRVAMFSNYVGAAVVAVCLLAVGISAQGNAVLDDWGEMFGGAPTQNQAVAKPASAAKPTNVQGKSIAITPPQGVGLLNGFEYLPDLVQGELVSNFSGYSTMSVFNRQNMEKVFQELMEGIYDENSEALSKFGRQVPTDYMLVGKITRVQTGNYVLQLSINQTSDQTTIASYSGTCTSNELLNFIGIRRASLELLEKMGVARPEAKTALAVAASTDDVSKFTSLSRGIVAQRQGKDVEAINYYNQAIELDPSLKEAASRTSILNASLTNVSIGVSAQQDVMWRAQWEKRLKETEEFVRNFASNESIPYTLFYVVDGIKQHGGTNYQNQTINMTMGVYLHASRVWPLAMERTLQMVQDGLNATGNAAKWGFAGWPNRNLADLKKTDHFKIRFELLNARNNVIGNAGLDASGTWELNGRGRGWGGESRPSINVSTSTDILVTGRGGGGVTFTHVVFNNVNINEITDNLTVRVVSINGVDAEVAALSGVLQVKAITSQEFSKNIEYRFSKGEILGLTVEPQVQPGYGFELTFPETVWDDPVIGIGNYAFRNKPIVSINIPKTVTFIGDEAFKNTYLTNVTIPAGVKIGRDAFDSKVVINNGVTSGSAVSGSSNVSAVTSGNSGAPVTNSEQRPHPPVFTDPIDDRTYRNATFTDPRVNKTYRTVKIGNQVWMAENLIYSGAYCYDIPYCGKYGGLYNWDAAMKACPRGWHLPTVEEWNSLIIATNTSGKRSNSGQNLKSTPPGWDGTNSHGFSALPGGYLYDMRFKKIGKVGRWWTATVRDCGESNIRGDFNRRCARYIEMNTKSNTVSMTSAILNNSYVQNAYSVRCVQD